MASSRVKLLGIIGAAAVAAAGLWLLLRPFTGPFHLDPALEASLNGIVADFRKVIVLIDGIETLDEAAQERSRTAGLILYWRKQEALDRLSRRLSDDYRQASQSHFRSHTDSIRQVIRFLSRNNALHDADKLAFLDVVEELESGLPRDAGRLNPLAGPLRSLKDNLQSVQLAYREEVTRIFAQFATRGLAGTREKWDAYVRFLSGIGSREKILSEMGDLMPPEPESLRGTGNEIFGNEFAPKTVALTFDDGPHPRYTEQVLALLRKYGIRATFFELGVNLGEVDASGQVTLGHTAEIAKKVLEAGHVIANHTYSHRVLPKLSPEERAAEIERTNALLQAVSGHKPLLFRAPYGARNQEILDRVTADGMRSVMWNIDSLDWADPVPESIAMRVLHQINQKHRGVILFHDIHKQSVMALTPVIEELQRQDYTFLGFENGQFAPAQAPVEVSRAPEPGPGPGTPDARRRFYRESWAVVVGINDYQRWPKLRYAVNDANAVEKVLVDRFGFKPENVRKLIDGDATRQRIMEVLGDDLTDGRKVQREDRVFFFFAGHGATRTLEDGRQIGFIVPVDADPSNYYSTAISMTALREASDLIPAKHIYFVMDSCYSGLALSRGSGGFSRDRTYLEEVTRRVARQILTAGGADQQVADDGPDGHSVFTWALLQGLQGRADLDGNGVITASELGAYVSPIVAQFAKQTPVVGNLVGSEGGEFLFELQPETLTSNTEQLNGQALALNQKLASLEKQIAARQDELLRLQQSIQAESAKLAQMSRGQTAAPAGGATVATASLTVQPRTKSKAARAYDLDRAGLQLYREKQYAAAEEKFQAAVDLKPGDPVLMNNLGYIYYVMGRYDDALPWLEKTLALDPKRKEAHENIAELFLKMGRKGDAREHVEQYIALAPKTAKAEEFRKILETLN